MKIKLNGVFVGDQEKALKFYTEVMGFVKKQDIPAGEFRWLTVVSPDDPDGTELVLEPNSNPAAKTYQEAIYKQGIPITAFETNDIQEEYNRMKTIGVKFKMEPTDAGSVIITVLDDTCGNLIQLYQATA